MNSPTNNPATESDAVPLLDRRNQMSDTAISNEELQETESGEADPGFFEAPLFQSRGAQ